MVFCLSCDTRKQTLRSLRDRTRILRRRQRGDQPVGESAQGRSPSHPLDDQIDATSVDTKKQERLRDCKEGGPRSIPERHRSRREELRITTEEMCADFRASFT